MYLLFLFIWIIFNRRFAWEIAAVDVVLAGVMYLFICKLMNNRPLEDILVCKKLFGFLHYLFLPANCITLMQGTVRYSGRYIYIADRAAQGLVAA